MMLRCFVTLIQKKSERSGGFHPDLNSELSTLNAETKEYHEQDTKEGQDKLEAHGPAHNGGGVGEGAVHRRGHGAGGGHRRISAALRAGG